MLVNVHQPTLQYCTMAYSPFAALCFYYYTSTSEFVLLLPYQTVFSDIDSRKYHQWDNYEYILRK